MKTILAAIAASGVLVTGAFVASAVTDAPASAQTDDITTAYDATTTDDPQRTGPLIDVLDGLVSEGILTRDQADEVESRLRAAGKELRAERRKRLEDRRERRQDRRADRQLIREFLADDVIDSDELAQLGDDHPFNDPDGRFADAAADGEITRDELREIRESLRSPVGDVGTNS